LFCIDDRPFCPDRRVYGTNLQLFFKICLLLGNNLRDKKVHKASTWFVSTPYDPLGERGN